MMIFKTKVTTHEHRCHDRYQVMQRDQNISGVNFRADYEALVRTV